MKAVTRNRLLQWVFGVCLVAVTMSLYIHKPPNPDQGIFDYIAWTGVTGGKYYVDVAEQNFPGEMILHEVAFRFFGISIWAYRALDFLILAVSAAALYGLLRTGGYGIGAFFGSAFYLVGYVSSNGWMAGQRDVVAANLLLIVGYFFVRRIKGGSRLWIVPLGLVLFIALLVRPTYLLFAVGLSALDICLMKRHSRNVVTCLLDAALVMAVLIACMAAMLAWSAYRGSLPDFWEQVILFNTQACKVGHSRLDTLTKVFFNLLGYVLFMPALALAIARSGHMRRQGYPFLILIGLSLLGLVSAIVQNKGFGYHLGAMLPPLFGLAGVAVWMAIEAILNRQGLPWWRIAVFGACAVLALFGLLLQMKTMGPQIRYLLGRETYLEMMARENGGQEGFSWADMLAAAEYARNTTEPEETVLVWGRPVSINLMARRRSPTRFITHGMLQLAKPPFEKSEAWIDEFREVFARTPPRLVFLPVSEDGSTNPVHPRDGGFDSVESILDHALMNRFDYIKSFGSLGVYRLRM
jgi:hypothetical protein